MLLRQVSCVFEPVRASTVTNSELLFSQSNQESVFDLLYRAAKLVGVILKFTVKFAVEESIRDGEFRCHLDLTLVSGLVDEEHRVMLTPALQALSVPQTVPR